VARHGARFVEQLPRRGPAAARNRGASLALGDLLVFVDSDVVVDPTALTQLVDLLEADREVAAVFGAYNEAPADVAFLSQYRNLAHSFVHQQANPEAQTFWAGLGAVRRSAFEDVGGFDERFAMPSVEDIDLGYRLRAAGHRIRLDHRIRGCHLKRWTFLSSIRIDVWCRGIPWTQLLLRSARLDNDLNIRAEYRLSVICAYLLVSSLASALVWPSALLVTALSIVALVSLNWNYYAYFARQRGVWFALRVVPLHAVHHLCNGVSFACGTALFIARRAGAVALPGALPAAPWSSGDRPVARSL
jgi:GT2 family glycosyltransferase